MTASTIARSRTSGRLSHETGFWVVAASFLVTMGFTVVPTPLWTIYQQRDGFSTFTITLAFAAYAVGVVVSLFLAGHVSDWLGRRTVLVPGLLLEAVSAALFITSSALPVLVVARVVSGLGVGLVTATATAHILELHTASRPSADRTRADLVSTGANMGGFAVGAILSGLLVQHVADPTVTPYVVFLVLILLSALALTLVPETVEVDDDPHPYRPQSVRVPREARSTYAAAAAIAFGGFAVLGLMTSLAPSFLAGSLHITSHATAGLVTGLAFAAAATGQILLRTARPRLVEHVGAVTIVAGVVLLVVAVEATSLSVFVVGGVLAGGGAGLVFKSALGRSAAIADPAHRGETLAGIFLAGYLGLVVPVVGMGVAVRSVALDHALAGFAVVVIVVVAAGWRVLGSARVR